MTIVLQRKVLPSKVLPARILTAVLVGCSGLFCSALLAAPQYLSSVIEPSEELFDQNYANLNGDNLQDLLLTVWSDQRGRELLVYLQGENGQFSAKPSRRIEVKKDIIAYGLAELREEPGEELVFLTRNGAYSYSSEKEAYAGNLEKLFEWESLITVPERKSLPFIGRFEDYNNDGHADILVPGQERYGFFRGDGDGGFKKVIPFPKPYHDPEQSVRRGAGFTVSSENGLVFSVERPSAFADLFPKRYEPEKANRATLGRFNQQSIVDVERWLASIKAARINNDDLVDFVYLDHPKRDGKNGPEERRRFNVLYQNAEYVNNGEPDWQQILRSSDQVSVADFNGDGLDDVLTLERKGSDQSNLAFFANRDGKYDFQSADQVLRFSGYEVEADFQDLNGDSYPELIVSYYSLAAVDALRSGSMLRTTLIYAGNPGSPSGNGEALAFARRPNTKLEDKFSADSVKGLTERLNFSADLTGNGRNEVLALDSSGALTAKTITKDLQIGVEPIWRFVPLHLIQSLMPESLNGDSSSDFILRHQNAVTVLVSRS